MRVPIRNLENWKLVWRMDPTPPAPSSQTPYTPSGYSPPSYTPPPHIPPFYTPPAFAPARPPRRRSGLTWLILGLFLTPVVACAALLAATAIAQPQLLARRGSIFAVSVTGAVYGEDASQREAGRESLAPVAGATVSCGDARAVTDAQGHYSLSQLRGRAYSCSLSAPRYISTTASIRPQLSGAYTLDFGAPGSTAGGACAPTPAGQRCGALALQPGSISGVAMDSDTHQPISAALVTCWDDSLAARVSQKNPAQYSAIAGPTGRYVVNNAPVGPYVCVAAQSGTPQSVVVLPGASASLDFSVCQSHCSGVSYHRGSVMHTFTGYVIFWTPPGARLDPGGDDARFRALVAQYLTDAGGSAFYGLLTQYWDRAGPARNVARLGDTYVDTQPYPHAGTRASPLTSQDISSEIERVVESRKWPVTPDTGFALFTAYGVETCATYQGQRSCSFPQHADTGFCAFHSSTTYARPGAATSSLLYMLIADVPLCAYLPTYGESPAPYGAPVADAAINSLSHEQFEMVSDPTGTGWYDSGDDSEIGDKCETSFGFPAADGSTVQLANGHGYVLQREWSVAGGACSYG